jgi:ABC-type branched-subunit amino acid transport system ATPase component/predicted MFS family arabinose efflux permease
MARRQASQVVDVPSGIDSVVDLDQTRGELHEAARVKLGITGQDQAANFRGVLRDNQLSVYPIIALGLLYISDNFQAFAFGVLTPEISRTLGISIGAISAAIGLRALAVAAAPLPVAALTQGRARRALLCIITGFLWSVLTLFTGFVTSLLGLILILVFDGMSTGSAQSLHTPLVMDSYPPAARVRAVSMYQAIGTAGNIVAPALVGLLASIAGFTWRGVFLLLGLTSVVMTLVSIGLRDPGFGKWDTEQLRASVREAHRDEGGTPDLAEEDVTLGFWEICRRVLLVPTNRRICGGFAVLGILVVPLLTFISFFLDERWNLGPGKRGLFFAYYAGAGVVALLAYGKRGEKQFSADPSRLLRVGGYLLGLGVSFIAIGGVMPWFWPMVVCFGISGGCIAVLTPALGVSLLSIVPSNMRAHAQSLAQIFAAIGGTAGALLLSGIQTQYGIAGAMISIAIPGVIAAFVIGSAGNLIQSDLDQMIDSVLEGEEIRRLKEAGAHLPMLSVRGIDFSYGQLQVLFDVDFTVDDGEMVALLGVNGAGKSTLLKVISGIGLPSRGSVRFRGQEITYLDPERRVGLGITQIPGGRAVFGPMTIVENLRSYGYTLGRDRAGIDRAIETTFAAFPRLYERRNSLAATLSGGEQQMLGLSKALILRPRLLLIDELSLGLAPVIVGQLLDMVRQINADGTAIVLVEQSVNIALNLVEHAYFMEKGEMRFDGRAEELLAREDLLRAVFLQGAGATS